MFDATKLKFGTVLGMTSLTGVSPITLFSSLFFVLIDKKRETFAKFCLSRQV